MKRKRTVEQIQKKIRIYIPDKRHNVTLIAILISNVIIIHVLYGGRKKLRKKAEH